MKSVVVYHICAMIALSGLALITVGTFSFIWFDLMVDIMENKHFAIPITAISLGCLLVFVSLGLMKIFSTRLSIWIYITIIILLALLGGTVLACHTNMVTDVLGSFSAAFLYRDSPEPRRIVDAIQQNLECCGENDPQSWGPIYIPTSCCPRNVQCDTETAFSVGCSFKIHDIITLSSELVAWSALGFAIFMCLTGFCTLLAYYKTDH